MKLPVVDGIFPCLQDTVLLRAATFRSIFSKVVYERKKITHSTDFDFFVLEAYSNGHTDPLFIIFKTWF